VEWAEELKRERMPEMKALVVRYGIEAFLEPKAILE
jgi:hypothetical protein